MNSCNKCDLRYCFKCHIKVYKPTMITKKLCLIYNRKKKDIYGDDFNKYHPMWNLFDEGKDEYTPCITSIKEAYEKNFKNLNLIAIPDCEKVIEGNKNSNQIYLDTVKKAKKFVKSSCIENYFLANKMK